VAEQDSGSPGSPACKSLMAAYEALLLRAPTPVLVHRGGAISYVNLAALSLLGASSPERLIGTDVFDLVDPEDHEAVRERIRAIVSSGAPSPPLPQRWRRLDGGALDVEVSGWIVPGETGPPLVVVMFSDITARLRAERELRDSEERYRGLFDDAPIAMHEIDSLGIVRRANRAECELLGFAAGELVGRPAWEMVASDLRDVSRARVAEKLTGLSPLIPFERPCRRRDGSIVLMEIHENLIRDHRGNPAGIRTAMIDITVKKRAEERLSAVAADIQRKNEELDRALNAAREAAEIKSQFLANISHEIRTPLNGVAGMTGLLLDTELSAEQREYAEMVRRSAETLLGIVNDMLDISRIEAGKQPVEASPFDLRRVAEDVLEMLAQRAGAKPVDLLVEYPGAVPRRFVGDAGLIRQVLASLVDNAIKFTAAGHVLIEVRCDGAGSPPALVRIAVSDTGIGIPAAKIGMVFDEFTQADGSYTRSHSGAGLGLAIAKRLVRLMGGAIGVDSVPGQGSTFWFTVPLALDHGTEDAPEPAVHLQGLRVLVVGGGGVSRRVLLGQLAGAGMPGNSLESAAGAVSALRQAQSVGDPYRFAILCPPPPSLEALELAARIKAEPKIAGTCLIMLTPPVGRPDEVRRLEACGIDACLVKPVREAQLLNAMRVLWSRRGSPLQSGAAGPAQAPDELPPAGAFAGAGTRVLVAEDNAINRKLAVHMLERMGLRADAAANGKEAMQMFGIAPYDVILMDCHMPEMHGYDAAREIRRLETAGRRVVIVAMIAETTAGARDSCLAAGMDDCISKPVRPQDLAAVLRKWAPARPGATRR